VETGSASDARVLGPNGVVLVSDQIGEEGRRFAGAWVPEPSELPERGVVRQEPDVARAFLPLNAPGAVILEVGFSIEPLRAVMDRGAILGLALTIASVLALAIIVGAMVEREVVGPLRGVEGLLEQSGSGDGQVSGDEVGQIRDSVRSLIRERQAVGRIAEAQDRELARAGGLAEVGELAAEMAHEFKRPLASIRTAIDLLEQEYHLDPSGRSVLGAVNGQLERLSETMQDLFSLARPVVIEPDTIRLDHLADEALLEVPPTSGRVGVTIERRYGDGRLEVRGDARRLRQGLANIMTNAMEAMPGGGTLTIEIQATESGSVEIMIADTGVGLPPSEVEQAFRPFYSTKPLGTGLGLPLVARVVRAHHGEISMESEPGSGTTVRISFPGGHRTLQQMEAEPWTAAGS
jgi:signal transduction histidine kinase